MSRTHHIVLRIVSQKHEISRHELIQTVSKFGRSPDAVRASIGRMVAAGLLAEETSGRGRTTYTAGPQGTAHAEELIRKTVRWFRFLSSVDSWDGKWTVVVFSIPETQRKQRDLLRGGLVQRGFGQLSPGVWIAPLDCRNDVNSLATALGVAGMICQILTDDVSVFGERQPRAIAETVWTLPALRKRYESFNLDARGFLEDANDTAGLDRERLFFGGIDLQGEFMEIILDEDPCLPKELLADDWPGLAAHDYFHRISGALAAMEPMNSTYGYLFHTIAGMEQVIQYHEEGQFDFFHPDD